MTGVIVDFQNEHGYPVASAELERAARTVIEAHSDQFAGESVMLSIVIADDQTVRALNREFRGIDQPTDVLSFPSPEVPPEIADEEHYLGDLVIAHPYASAQAEREGHVLSDSLSLLVIHGTLHLLGYDHHDQVSKAEMWAAQAQAMTALNLPLEIVPALEQASHDETSSP